MKTTFLIEQLDLTEAVLNSANRTVRQRLIKAGMSLNGRDYSESVLRQAIPIFENVQTYRNHPTIEERKSRPERDTSDLTGWISDVIYENDALYATRHFFRTQAGNDSFAIVEDIVSGAAPASVMGASINAVGKAKMTQRDGKNVTIVESIDKVTSVDDVTLPGAGGGFVLMQGGGDEATSALLSALDYQEWFEARPEFVKRVQGEMKTVRQDDAVKASKDEADRLKAQLKEAQEALKTVKVERDAALTEVQSKERKLSIVGMLAKVTLPQSYKEDLQERLQTIPQNEWKSVIEKELQKAKSANVLPRVPVSGSEQSIHSTRVTESLAPSLISWMDIDTPEKQKALLER